MTALYYWRICMWRFMLYLFVFCGKGKKSTTDLQKEVVETTTGLSGKGFFKKKILSNLNMKNSYLEEK